ncbi:MAG: hypothetical protein E7364_06620 [Clostridiales bacterium]|nr:hypothetical protein [Clostridiales bacterium]
MGVDKVILRAFLNTLAAIGILILFLFAALCTFYPSTMMKLTYDLGMESASIHFAERAYKDSDDIYYIAYATEVAIGEGKDGKIDTCGERFIEDDEFHAYCLEKDEELGGSVNGTYEQYVCGQVCIAKYCRGDKEEAVECAFEWKGESFQQNNAVVAVLITALQAGDSATAQMIKGKMEQIEASVSDTDRAYFDRTLGLIKN